MWYISYPRGSAFVEIPGENGPSLRVSPDDETDYRVRVFNSCGEAVSPILTVVMWDGRDEPPDDPRPI